MVTPFVTGTSNGMYLVDEPITNGHTYGITWDEAGYLYLGNNRTSAGGVDRITPHLGSAERIHHPVHDIHQILWWDGALYVTNTGLNQMDIIRDGKITSRKWNEPKDDIHLNSVWCDGELLWAVEHRRGIMPARIRAFDAGWNMVRTVKFYDLHTACHWGLHNVYVEDGVLYTLSTLNFIARDLETDEEKRVELDGYLRGLARGEDFWLVGKSRIAPRQKRNEGNGSVLVLDDDFNLVDEIMLPGCGQVHEVRLLDGDRAHNGLSWMP